MTPMAAEQFNADQLAFWNGAGGRTWVARQTHTDITLAPVSEALLDLAAPRAGERVLDVGCGCGASTLDFARAVGPTCRVAALDISGPMLAEAQARTAAAGIANVEWRQANAAIGKGTGTRAIRTVAAAHCACAFRDVPPSTAARCARTRAARPELASRLALPEAPQQRP